MNSNFPSLALQASGWLMAPETTGFVVTMYEVFWHAALFLTLMARGKKSHHTR